MLKPIIDAGVPVLVFFAMVVVGMELTTADFWRIARQPRVVVAATLGQIVLLPLLGWFLVRSLKLQPAVAQGLLLVAGCPSGAMANVYAYIARANVALSVTLTAVSCLVAAVTTPPVLAVLHAHAGETTEFAMPVRALVGQLLVLLVLPVLTGMAIRHRWADITKNYGRALLALNVAALAALLGFVIGQQWQQFAAAFTNIAIAGSLLTVLAFGAGWAVGWAVAPSMVDRFTIGMVFVVRNVGIATAIAVTVLGKIEFAVFATAYFLVQVPILLAGVMVFRHKRRSTGGDVAVIRNP